MFCCLKEKAFNLTSVSLEDSQLVTDDIVQVCIIINMQSVSNFKKLSLSLDLERERELSFEWSHL